MVKKVFAALFFLLFLALPAFAEEAPALPPEIGALTEKNDFQKRSTPVSACQPTANEYFVLYQDSSYPLQYHMIYYVRDQDGWRTEWVNAWLFTLDDPDYPPCLTAYVDEEGHTRMIAGSNNGESPLSELHCTKGNDGIWRVTSIVSEYGWFQCTLGDGWQNYTEYGDTLLDVQLFESHPSDLEYFSWADYHTDSQQLKALTRSLRPLTDGGKIALNILYCSLNSTVRYPVYSGPGTHYYRAGNGKACVSGAKMFGVLGHYDGWLMIYYQVSKTQYRVGYIEVGDDPQLQAIAQQVDIANIEMMDALNPLSYHGTGQIHNRSTYLYDDPFSTEHYLVKIPAHTYITTYIFGDYGAFGAELSKYQYIEAEINGKLYRGFIWTDDKGNG